MTHLLSRAAAAVFVAALLLRSEASQALSFAEYDRMALHERENFVSTVLHFFYFTYQGDPATASKADCMTELEEAASGLQDPHLSGLILRDLRPERRGDVPGASVEETIAAMIDRACPSG